MGSCNLIYTMNAPYQCRIFLYFALILQNNDSLRTNSNHFLDYYKISGGFGKKFDFDFC